LFANSLSKETGENTGEEKEGFREAWGERDREAG